MLRAVELKNVRVFSASSWRFEIAPVTAFCGVNSSGKSTVIKSVLLLKQSQETLDRSRDQVDGRLSFSGPYVDLGNFAAYVSKGETRRDSSIALELDASDQVARALELLESRGVEPSTQCADDLVLRCAFRFGLADTGPVQPEASTGGPAKKCRLKQVQFDLNWGDTPVLSWAVLLRKPAPGRRPRRARTDYCLRMPRWYFEQEGGDKFVRLSPNVRENIRLSVLMNGLLPESLSARLRADWMEERMGPEAEVAGGLQLVPLPPLVQRLTNRVEDFLESVHYIGPLRAPAKRFYFTDVDAAAALSEGDEDYVMHALRTGRDCLVVDLPPGRGTLVERNLYEAIESWLHYFRTGRRVAAAPKRDEIVLRQTAGVILQPAVLSPYAGGATHALADSGFGYSQSLPILIALLTASQGSTTLIEQPELHLHPSLQVRLSEFLVSMARAGRRIVVETHSEHIVNALRAAVAETRGTRLRLKEQCRVYYFEAAGSGPKVSDLSVQADGTMSEWPASFFGESTDLARRLVRAQLASSKRARREGH